MKLIPYDIKKVRNVKGYVKSKNQKILDEFIAANQDCMKLEGWTSKTADSVANSLRASIKRFRYNGVTAMCRDGMVFLIKTNT